MRKHCKIYAIKFQLVLMCTLNAGELNDQVLPFNRDVINRYSLDHLPRSLSIRQGSDVWLGYDLERAKLYKLWRAPVNKPGLTKNDFVVRSVGTTWFEDKSDATWQLQRQSKIVPVAVRYIGCKQLELGFELRWELKHDVGSIHLFERVPMVVASASDRVVREIRAESLAMNEALLVPRPARELWKLESNHGAETLTLTGDEWHRMILP